MQRAASAPNLSALTVATPDIRPSAGVFWIRSSTLRRRRCAAIASEPYSTKEPGSTSCATFSRAVRWLVLRRRSTAPGRFSSFVMACRAFSSARSARMWSRSTSASSATSCSSSSTGSRNRIASPCIRVVPAPLATLVTLPPCGALTRCSIFMDSSTAICWPGRTRSPSATSMLTTVPCSGAGPAPSRRERTPTARPRPASSRYALLPPAASRHFRPHQRGRRCGCR